LKPEDIPDEIIEVYPDNWKAFLVFDCMSTQWRSGGFGATGLDYNVIPLVLESLEIERNELGVILQDLRVLEAEALKVMNEMRENKK
jgi:hypothetical protein